MARKPVSITTREFGTQGEATEFFKEILNRYRPGDRVSDDDAFDVAALLERHPEYAQKVGIGLDHFEVMLDPLHGTQCFRIVRHDGSGTDFSYLTCVRGVPPSRKTEVSHAFREAIRMDLYRARDSFYAAHRDADGLASCAVTGAKLRPDEGHMDHRPPLTFEVLVTTFLGGRGLSYDGVAITTGEDNQVTARLTDPVLEQAFQQYHGLMAKLDFVEKRINLAQSARSRIRPNRVNIST